MTKRGEEMARIKRLLSIFLIAAMLVLPDAAAFAEENISEEARICNELGILSGDEGGFNSAYLAKSTSKLQAAIVMLKLLGRYETAVNYTYGVSNFTDSEQLTWEQGKNILSYLKDNPSLGWQGNSDGTFGIKDKATSQMLYKVMLQLLGYVYSNEGYGDFTWNETIDFARSVGLGRIAGWSRVTNGDLAVCIYETLLTPVNGGTEEETLAAWIAQDNPDFAAKAEVLGLLQPDAIVSVVQPDPVDVEHGGAPELPEKVAVIYESGKTEQIDVIWNPVDTSLEGPQEVEGIVDGTDLTARIIVNVIPKSLDFTIRETELNLKEIVIDFNKPADSIKAGNKNNYSVKVGALEKAIDRVVITDDNKSAVISLSSVLNQQDRVDVTLKAGIGLEHDATKTIESVVDAKPPEVEKVCVIGNRLIQVTFSEPVLNAASISNYSLDGKPVSGSVSVKGRTASILLSRRLLAGAHKLEASTNIIDYAGYKLIYNLNDFNVVKDITPPKIELVKATQTELVVRFSEPVETLLPGKVTTKASTVATSVVPDEDLKTYTITFSRTAALPANGTEVTFADVADYSGIKATLKINVIPEIDMQAPTYLGYNVEKQSKIILQFSEPVVPSGTFLLTDEKGAVVALSAPMWHIDPAGYVDMSRLVLQRSGTNIFNDGAYTLQIGGIVDNTPMENKMTPQTVNILVQDQTQPGIVDVKINGRMLFVTFSEKVNPAAAVAKANYRYMEDLVSKPLPAGTAVELLSDGATVKITFPDSFNMGTIDAFQAENVIDLTGNIMEVEAKPAPFSPVGDAPKVTDVAVAGKNTITLSLNGPINSETLSAASFTVEAGKYLLQITDISYNQNDKKIILTVNGDMTTDGLFEKMPVLIRTTAALSVSNVYGQKLQPVPAAVAADRYAPYASGMSVSLSGGNTNIVIFLSENIKTTNGSGKPLVAGANELNQFIVLVDGVVKAVASSRYDNADSTQPARITLSISGDQTGREINVKFFAGPTNTLTDYAPTPNSIANFDLM